MSRMAVLYLKVGGHGWVSEAAYTKGKNALGFETVHFLDDGVIFNQKLSVLFVRAASGISPSGGDGLFVEGSEYGLFDVVGNGHVVFDGIQTTQDEIVHANLRQRWSAGSRALNMLPNKH